MTGSAERLGFIGAGRVAQTLAAAFTRAGWPVVAATSRRRDNLDALLARAPGAQALASGQEVAAACSLVLLTVADDAIAPVSPGSSTVGISHPRAPCAPPARRPARPRRRPPPSLRSRFDIRAARRRADRMALAATPVIATPGFATMVTPAPPAEIQTAIGTGWHWLSGGVQILFVGLLVPVGILLVGAPIVLVVRGVIALLQRF